MNTLKPLACLAPVAFAALLAASAPALAGTPVVNQAITEAEVMAAQQAWCSALVGISAAHQRGGATAARTLAEQVIDQAYAFQMGAVLFKPTLTVAPQTFRTTREGALAYFVGGDPAFAQDSGFALKGWTQCRVDNAAVFITGDSATTMGHVHITNGDGQVTTVDKTWKFVKDDQARLRIAVHHSSLPFAGG
jgi:hypothetical protein